MKKFHVYGAVSGSKYLGEFEAETEEDATEMALKAHGSVSLCNRCAGECEDAEITSTTAEEHPE